MRKTLMLFLAAVLALPALARASADTDLAKFLDDANLKVSGLSAIKSPSATNIDSVKGELNSLPPFFATVAQRLAGLNITGATQLVEAGAAISLKVNNAGQISTVDISTLITTCSGLSGDLVNWGNLLAQVRQALQGRIDAAAVEQGRQQVNQLLPTVIPGAAIGPISLPTPTPQPFTGPTPMPAITPLVPPATAPTPLPPVDGGLIPGGYVAPTPTPRPAGGDDDKRPTAVPTPVGVRKAPVPVAAGHNGQRVWVANVSSGSVSVMDAHTQRFTALVPVGSQPSSLALDDGDNTLVVANSGSSNVTLVDARKDTVIKTLNVGAHPVQVLVTHGGRAYVACQEGRSIAVIDLKLQLLVKNIALSSRPGRMDTPNGNDKIYITLPDEDSVAVLDTSFDDVTSTIAE